MKGNEMFKEHLCFFFALFSLITLANIVKLYALCAVHFSIT